ncbi:MAG TPA: nucleotide-binding protein [Pyrinomonadaceae bacterium]|nr:nucleotide-binding protein [Pyrinomonadaceae bacterium]
MPNISQQDAIAILEKLLERSKSLQDKTTDYFGWLRSVRVALVNIFGEQSKQLQDFNSWSSLSGHISILNSIKDDAEIFWSGGNPAPPDSQEAARGKEVSPPGRNDDDVPDRRTVFVVHGRNLKAREALFRFLRSIGLKPLEWSQAVNATGDPSPYIGNVLNVAFSLAQAVVVLMTPDDEARLREPLQTQSDPHYESSLTPQARPNVLFEAGIAMGRSADRTVLVELGETRPFSDIGGRHVIKLTDSTQKRQELAHRLASAGCPVDLSGVDWHTEGDFAGSLK